jgi:predicted nucleic acid-binding protein
VVRVFVDTSGLFALLDEDDSNHRDASQLFGRLPAATEYLTSNYVVVEAIALVRRRLGPAAEERLINEILPILRVVWVDEATHRSAAALYGAAGRSASLVDHVSFVIMEDAGLTLAFAFDADFDRRGFRRPSPPADTGPRQMSEARAPYATLTPGASELVSVAEVAARAGRSTNTVQSWRRRHHDFPTPVAQLASGPVWTWAPVADWIALRTRPRRAPRAPLFESAIPDLAARADSYMEGFGER